MTRPTPEDDLRAAVTAFAAGRISGPDCLAAVLAHHRRGVEEAAAPPIGDDVMAIPVPSISTGPRDLSARAAAQRYLREVAAGIGPEGKVNHHGAGVSSLVFRVLSSVADAMNQVDLRHPDAAAVASRYWSVDAPCVSHQGVAIVTLVSKVTRRAPTLALEHEADELAAKLITGPALSFHGVTINGNHMRRYHGTGTTELARRREGLPGVAQRHEGQDLMNPDQKAGA